VRISEAGYTVRVVDPRWVTPVPPGMADLARQTSVLVTVEDGVQVNGAGARITQYLRDRQIFVHTREIGVPVEFLEHGSVREVRSAIGLNPQGISRRVIEFAAAVLGRGELDPADSSNSSSHSSEGNGGVLTGVPEDSASSDDR
jgi:1-deoxy-D-xylulose-5-phosphate synthase